MERIGLAETVQAVRNELAVSVAAAIDEEIQFPVGRVVLEFHVGVTKTAGVKGGVRFWLVELGAGGEYATESIQKVTVTLEPPVDRQGQPVRVTRGSRQKP